MFVVCGEALWDLYGADGPAGLTFDARIGGSPFNVAIGLARLGQSVSLLTGLSTDRLGQRLFRKLEAEGVGTELLVRRTRPTTLSIVEVAPDGSPEYTFYGKDAADRALEVRDLPRLGPEVWGLHAGSFSLVAEPVGTSLLTLLEESREGRLVTLDPNVRLSAEPDIALWRDRVEAFVRLSDLVKVSQEDLTLLYPAASPTAIADRWRSAGASLVVVTRGNEGAEAHGAFGSVQVPGVAVPVADTVGAGDSFMSALVAGLAERGVRAGGQLAEMPSREAVALLRFAIKAAAITCTRRGADPPTRDEL